ncbi:DNA adenine methylase [Fundidesulfovibrio putealis]|uniref:DNA adenine methylase n=1 Tax=Fundidesulfovibrio putealis TaxID=270496 RepID=UPI00146F9BFC|nr:DNA adenine methylase [Fundidesulfovibrio putealis]
MRYFGSKTSVVEQIYSVVSGKIPSGSFCDPFGGIGTVGSYFKQKGYAVITGDILEFAHTYQVAKIEQDSCPTFERLKSVLKISNEMEITDYLNAVKPVTGWLTREYGVQRKFFTKYNARRIDACYIKILNWKKKGLLTKYEYSTLIASLINSVDKVANTAGTYYAFLKSWHRKASNPFCFELITPSIGASGCRSYRMDASAMVKAYSSDILYLDPPYNGRSYARYYHLPETIALGLQPAVTGLSGMPVYDFRRSKFNSARSATKALEDLLKFSKFRVLVFHYSDDGFISPMDAKKILQLHGLVTEFEINATGYTSTKRSRSVKHRMYLVENS